jgi:hypothetical protein
MVSQTIRVTSHEEGGSSDDMEGATHGSLAAACLVTAADIPPLSLACFLFLPSMRSQSRIDSYCTVGTALGEQQQTRELE